MKKDKTETLVKSMQKKEGELIVNGLYLPEKEKKQDLIQRTIYYKPVTYTNLALISKKINVPMNTITNTLLEQFINENKHLLTTKKD